MSIIQQYYDAFNRKDWADMLSMVTDDVRHDSNQGDSRHGKALFSGFLAHMDRCYDEQVTQLVVMSNPDYPDRIACEFVIEGTYKVTDSDLPPATGQRYSLSVGSFFDLRDGKIARVTTYYNLPLWIEMVSK